MKLKHIRDDTRGGALVESTLTMALFLSLTFGLVQAGLLLWSQSGLQHGVELAARCASVNYSAKLLNLSTSCFTALCNETPLNASTDTTCIEKYVAQNSFGLVPSYNNINFTIGTPPTTKCDGTNVGYSVQANYSFKVALIFSVPLTALSCFPINVS